MLDPDIPKRLMQQPVTSTLGIDPTNYDIATAMRVMVNAKVIGPDGLPAELLNSDSDKTGPFYWSSNNLPPSSDARGNSHSNRKTRSSPYSTRRATRLSAKTTVASRSCRTQVRCSLEWLLRRSSADFDRIARPRA